MRRIVADRKMIGNYKIKSRLETAVTKGKTKTLARQNVAIGRYTGLALPRSIFRAAVRESEGHRVIPRSKSKVTST
jgi:hypothetical protein